VRDVTERAYGAVVVGTDGSLGSVPVDASRRSTCDVLVVHTTG
jgi:nucleotide-binding universal stress UspA family protein